MQSTNSEYVASLSVALNTVKKKNESVLILIRIFIIVSLLNIVNTQFEHEHCTVLTST